MKIATSQVTKMYLTELDRLDPVTIIAEDLEPGKGQITISCWGKVWIASWNAMHTTIKDFFRASDDSYLAQSLSKEPTEIADYEALSEILGEHVEEATLLMFDSKLGESLGEYWFDKIPMRPNPEYNYICRIVKTVKKAFEESK